MNSRFLAMPLYQLCGWNNSQRTLGSYLVKQNYGLLGVGRGWLMLYFAQCNI